MYCFCAKKPPHKSVLLCFLFSFFLLHLNTSFIETRSTRGDGPDDKPVEIMADGDVQPG